jgi:uncharacterized protein
LQLLTNPNAFGAGAVTLDQAWQKYDLYRLDPRIEFADEPTATEHHWRNFTQQHSFSPKIWSDAYLAGFALAGGLTLVTFDQGFSKFPGVHCLFLP